MPIPDPIPRRRPRGPRLAVLLAAVPLLLGGCLVLAAPALAQERGAQAAAAREGTLPSGPPPVRVDVTMLCGCPIEAGGMWDAYRVTVTAELVRDGRVVATARLPFAGETNIFGGELVPPGEGRYELRVTAVDADRANTGMVTRAISVGPA